MADVHDSATRSYNMSQIKGKDTKPEIIVRKFLFQQGFRYRLHDKKLPGKPDIVMKKYKTVIMVNGCFWHGHNGCKYFVIPKTNTDWWIAKIQKTIEKDKENIAQLKDFGWSVIVLWECELRQDKREETLKNLLAKLKDEDTGN